jgi:hypothetical protein
MQYDQEILARIWRAGLQELWARGKEGCLGSRAFRAPSAGRDRPFEQPQAWMHRLQPQQGGSDVQNRAEASSRADRVSGMVESALLLAPRPNRCRCPQAPRIRAAPRTACQKATGLGKPWAWVACAMHQPCIPRQEWALSSDVSCCQSTAKLMVLWRCPAAVA